MNEYRCGKCGWTAVAPHLEGILAASKEHEKQGCFPKEEEKDEQ